VGTLEKIMTEKKSEVELQIVNRGRIYSLKVTSITNEGYINLYGYDITEREHIKREIESRAHQNENLARLRAENPSPVLKITTSGEVLFTNAAGKLILDDWGCDIGDHIPEEWRSPLTHLSKEPTASFLYESTTGKTFSFKVVSIPDSGYFNLFGHDISELENTRKLKVSL